MRITFTFALFNCKCNFPIDYTNITFYYYYLIMKTSSWTVAKSISYSWRWAILQLDSLVKCVCVQSFFRMFTACVDNQIRTKQNFINKQMSIYIIWCFIWIVVSNCEFAKTDICTFVYSVRTSGSIHLKLWSNRVRRVHHMLNINHERYHRFYGWIFLPVWNFK